MEHVIVKFAKPSELEGMKQWQQSTLDGELFDADVLEHESTFVLEALGSKTGRIAFLPVQQPLMLESLGVKLDLKPGQIAQALTRLVEYAISECYRRDAAELYFLTRDKETADFAQRHHFRPLPDGLQVYRLNLRETFGIS